MVQAQHIMSTYGRLPVSFVRGEGAWLWDADGNKYLDALAGVAVCSLGHSHPAVTEAICQQAGTLLHTSNWYGIDKQEQLAEQLSRLAGMDNVFFSNSGAEAVETAIKLARLYGHQHDSHDPAIIVTEQSFHGRTLATLTATGSRKVQAGFEPLVPGFKRVPYDDLEAVKQVGASRNNVVAVMVEPVLGEGGVVLPAPGYLRGLRQICDEHGWLLILDEIQTGMGRTGKWFAGQHEDVIPDIMTLAKGLGNGVPIGACLARGAAAEVFEPGKHGSTFGGNPLVCNTALAVIETLEKENLPVRAGELGARMLERLKQSLTDITGVTEVRGLGLMLAIELDRPCQPLMTAALEHGLLIGVTAESVVRLLPPLILTDAEADQIVTTVSERVCAFLEAA